MTLYSVQMYVPADAYAPSPEEEQRHTDYFGVVEQMGGKIVEAHALCDPATATSVRGDLVTDGPFVEAKEVLTGVYLLEARDLDHALAMARANPVVGRGGVEVRPILGRASA